MFGVVFVLFNLIEYVCVCWLCINRDGCDIYVWFVLCEGIFFFKFMLCVINYVVFIFDSDVVNEMKLNYFVM